MTDTSSAPSGWTLGWQHLGVVGCLLSNTSGQLPAFIKAVKDKEDGEPGWIAAAFAGDRTVELMTLIRDHSTEWAHLSWDWSLFDGSTLSVMVVAGLGPDVRDMTLTLDTLYLPVGVFPSSMHTHAQPALLPAEYVRIYATFDAADALIECDKVVTTPGDPTYQGTVKTKAVEQGFGAGNTLGQFDLVAEDAWIGESRVEKVVNPTDSSLSLRIVVGQDETPKETIREKIHALTRPAAEDMPAWPCGALAGMSRAALGGC